MIMNNSIGLCGVYVYVVQGFVAYRRNRTVITHTMS